MCVCARLSSAKLDCERLKQAEDDKSSHPERLTQLLTEIRNDRDKVLCMFAIDFLYR